MVASKKGICTDCTINVAKRSSFWDLDWLLAVSKSSCSRSRASALGTGIEQASELIGCGQGSGILLMYIEMFQDYRLTSEPLFQLVQLEEVQSVLSTILS